MHSCSHKEFAVLPDPASRTVTILSCDTCKNCAPSISSEERTSQRSFQYARFAWDGTPISHGRLVLPDYAGATITALRPVDRGGGFCVEVEALTYLGLVERRISLHFNEVRQSFIMFSHAALDSGPAWCVDAATVWWKDSFYQLPPPAKQTEARTIVLAHIGTRFAESRVLSGANC